MVLVHSMRISSVYVSPMIDQRSGLRRLRRNMFKNCVDMIDISESDENENEADFVFQRIKSQRKIKKFKFTKIWNSSEILHWFDQIGYGKYVNILRPHFDEIEMDGRGLKMIDMNDLREFGITNFYDRKIILKKIKKLIF